MTRACFHCHQPVPEGLNLHVDIMGQSQPMCCYGCQAVAQTIVEQDLESFYKFRQTENNNILPLVPDELQKDDLSIYDEPEVQAEFSFSSANGQEAWLAIEGMTCAACAWLIEKHLQQQPGIQKVFVNSSTDRLRVTWNKEKLLLSTILNEIENIGYRARPFKEGELEEQFQKRRKGLIRRLGVAGIASMQTMMVAFGLYYDDIDSTTRLYFWWVSLLFSAPVFVYSCQPFYANAIKALRTRTLNMDVPVSIAIIFAFFASMYATITNQGEVYFECVTMFAFFLLTGRYLELLAKHKAITDAANLMKLTPSFAEVWHEEQWQTKPVHQLSAGDKVRVKPGSVIPIDGEIETQKVYVNEAQLTGESHPIPKAKGENVYAGSLNLDTPLQLIVTKPYQDSLLAKIIQLQDDALALKPKAIDVADRIGRNLVLGTLIIALITYITWLWVDADRAFWILLSVLVATCPCALALASPTAVSSAVSRLNRLGVLLKNADASTNVNAIKTICFDKTGTLTEGHFKITDSWFAESEHQNKWLTLACELESWSEHPISKAFTARDSETYLQNVENIPGKGLYAEYQAKQILIGSHAFLAQHKIPMACTLPSANVYMAYNGELVAAWRVDDQLRNDAKSTISALSQQGYHCVMLTGDNDGRAQEIADKVGIKEVHAGLTPQDKLSKLQEMQRSTPVLMVGDGINDGPVLAGANVSVTFSAGSELAQASSDVVILNQKLSSLVYFIQYSKRLARVIFQNFIWAFGYNGIILPLAAFGFVDPLIAMLGMSASSLIVITNSLRLIRK
ncbi:MULTISPECIES: heavy metal translocating P-type ATPase [Gammaproteobacteria]|uniref:heavy metal translocating P-type ATPase n=1 Tax=Gammaproteobacteria TaxID=1236 RepID=UPI000DD00055|nr:MULTISPECIES: heavy metal translocating P-type ATPase [Gammaproteobacteria]RTE87244.1 cadmium-translocating P-type ATPase [Aliidiomarina sp. B3213]TCZ92969.1 cadmium-translocating P-type ATPase [Lysobacter sp. N42]